MGPAAQSADGAALTGQPVALMTNTKPWQGNLVEAPEMVVHGGHYMLFYSANDYASDKYGIGYASCTGAARAVHRPVGRAARRLQRRCRRPGPLLRRHVARRRLEMLYHAWPPDAIGSQDPGRQLWLEPLTWHGDIPSVHPSEVAPQAIPR